MQSAKIHNILSDHPAENCVALFASEVDKFNLSVIAFKPAKLREPVVNRVCLKRLEWHISFLFSDNTGCYLCRVSRLWSAIRKSMNLRIGYQMCRNLQAGYPHLSARRLFRSPVKSRAATFLSDRAQLLRGEFRGTGFPPHAGKFGNGKIVHVRKGTTKVLAVYPHLLSKVHPSSSQFTGAVIERTFARRLDRFCCRSEPRRLGCPAHSSKSNSE